MNIWKKNWIKLDMFTIFNEFCKLKKIKWIKMKIMENVIGNEMETCIARNWTQDKQVIGAQKMEINWNQKMQMLGSNTGAWGQISAQYEKQLKNPKHHMRWDRTKVPKVTGALKWKKNNWKIQNITCRESNWVQQGYKRVVIETQCLDKWKQMELKTWQGSNRGSEGCKRAWTKTLGTEPDGQNSDFGRLLRSYVGDMLQKNSRT